MPELYDRARIPVEFFEALQGMLTLRKVDRLAEAQLYRLFPSVETLTAIESRYGEVCGGGSGGLCVCVWHLANCFDLDRIGCGAAERL
jgi:hypothetical protein